jgi:hypothetical protein
MNELFRFLASPAGRVTRAALGVGLVLIGVLAIEGTVGWVVAAIGVVPFAAGVFDVCVFSPLVGLPFSGPELRQAVRPRTRRST